MKKSVLALMFMVVSCSMNASSGSNNALGQACIVAGAGLAGVALYQHIEETGRYGSLVVGLEKDYRREDSSLWRCGLGLGGYFVGYTTPGFQSGRGTMITKHDTAALTTGTICAVATYAVLKHFEK